MQGRYSWRLFSPACCFISQGRDAPCLCNDDSTHIRLILYCPRCEDAGRCQPASAVTPTSLDQMQLCIALTYGSDTWNKACCTPAVVTAALHIFKQHLKPCRSGEGQTQSMKIKYNVMGHQLRMYCTDCDCIDLAVRY